MADSEEIQFLKAADSMDEWDEFVTNSPQGCIFCRSWWLEAVCPGQYEILLLRRGPRILAGMPMHRSRKWGFEAIHMPPLTQTLGVLLSPPASENYEKNLSAEMDVIRVLVKAIPKVSVFNVNFHYNFTNWLPFYWAGFRQTTCYSYALEDLIDLEKVFAGFAHSKRKNIKKAESVVEVKEDLPPADFYANHKLTLGKQGSPISYSSGLFHRLHAATRQRNAGKTWYAVDKDGHLHAAIFAVFDSKSAYYLISTIDPDYRNSGAATLLLKRAIEHLAPYTRRFDFEGSMIEGVECSFRRFGARQIPYFAITRSNIAMAHLHACRQVLEKLQRRRLFP
jgi:hypothetical protein